MVKYKKA